MIIESSRDLEPSIKIHQTTVRWKSTINLRKMCLILVENRKLKSMENWKLHVIIVCVQCVFRRIILILGSISWLSWCTPRSNRIEILFHYFRNVEEQIVFDFGPVYRTIDDDRCNETIIYAFAMELIFITINFKWNWNNSKKLVTHKLMYAG